MISLAESQAISQQESRFVVRVGSSVMRASAILMHAARIDNAYASTPELPTCPASALFLDWSSIAAETNY